MFLKLWLAATFATMAVYYTVHTFELIKEAVSVDHRDGSVDEKK